MRIITFFTFMIMFTAIFSLTSCNTFDGMGQDIQKGGKVISDAAN